MAGKIEYSPTKAKEIRDAVRRMRAEGTPWKDVHFKMVNRFGYKSSVQGLVSFVGDDDRKKAFKKRQEALGKNLDAGAGQKQAVHDAVQAVAKLDAEMEAERQRLEKMAGPCNPKYERTITVVRDAAGKLIGEVSYEDKTDKSMRSLATFQSELNKGAVFVNKPLSDIEALIEARVQARVAELKKGIDELFARAGVV